MSYTADNAIIMAAGLSSRFAPLSYERPKALIKVKGEVLIERQIRQLREAGIQEIVIVTGYRKEQFEYLRKKFGVKLVENPEYAVRNNNGTIYAAKEYIRNSYICSSDNYFSRNPFEKTVDESYYAAIYSEGETGEWCMEEDSRGYIRSVTIGGRDSWYMMGHTFWSEEFSRRFLEILEQIYEKPETRDKLWESIYIEHLEKLPMKMKKYGQNDIYEFDSLDDLREFDKSYICHSDSRIMERITDVLQCSEAEICKLLPAKDNRGMVTGVRFRAPGGNYEYDYETGCITNVF